MMDLNSRNNGKRVLLYTPPTIKGNVVKGFGLPLSLLYASRELHEHGYNLDFIDWHSYQYPYEELKLKAKSSGMICITSMTGYQIIDGLRASEIAKQVNPDIKVVWGGWHVSLLPEQSIKNDLIDALVVGQGEESLLEIALRVENKESLENIKGVWTKKSRNVESPICKHINSFSRVPFEKIDLKKYIYQTEFGKRNIDYISSYGCPYQCGFCCVQLIHKRKWTGFPAENVVRDIKCFKEKYNITSITFSDANFFNDLKRVADICKGLIDQNIKIRWGNAQGRVKQLANADDQFWKLLVDSGCYSILIGAESGDEEVLELINKKMSVDDLQKLERKASKYNIKLLYSFLTGIDMEMRENRDFLKTLQLIRRLNNMENRYLFSMYIPYPGTELYRMSLNHGFVPPKTLEEWGEFDNYAHKNASWQSNKLVQDVAFFSQYLFMFLDRGSLRIILSFVNRGAYIKKLSLICAYLFFYVICVLRWRLSFFSCRIDFQIFKLLKNKF